MPSDGDATLTAQEQSACALDVPLATTWALG
jgi:hypothetical protein